MAFERGKIDGKEVFIVRTNGEYNTPSLASFVLGGNDDSRVIIDIDYKTITFPDDTLIIGHNTYYQLTLGKGNVSAEFSFLQTTAVNIVYQISTGALVAKAYTEKINIDDNILLCSVRVNADNTKVSMNCPYDIIANGVAYTNFAIKDSARRDSYIAPLICGYHDKYAVIDSTLKKITFPIDTLIVDPCAGYAGEVAYYILREANRECSFSGITSTAIKVYYNIAENALFAVDYTINQRAYTNCILLAVIRTSQKTAAINLPYIYDGFINGFYDANTEELSKNLYCEKDSVIGFVQATGDIFETTANGEKSSDFIPVVENEKYTLQVWVKTGAGGYWGAYAFYDANKVFISRTTQTAADGVANGVSYSKTAITVPTGAAYIRITARLYDDGVVKFERGDIATKFEYNVKDIVTQAYLEKTYQAGTNNDCVRSINHRGYNTEAPENTLSAFKLSKKKGFDYVECDVAFTKDGVPVLLHDTAIDRTSNGAGKISELTFDEVRALDFGGWKAAKYAGEKIPTFYEFIVLCKRIGLKAYVEIKNVPVPTSEQVALLVSIAKRYGMEKNISWLSFSEAVLENVLSVCPSARVGLVCDTLTSENIAWAETVKTDTNEVFVDVGYSTLTEEVVSACVNAGIPLEVWTVNTVEEVLALDGYISGVTSDNISANAVLYNNFID